MPIKIGETVHATTKTGGLIHRVNPHEVVAYGERAREREHAKDFIGSLTFRPEGGV